MDTTLRNRGRRTRATTTRELHVHVASTCQPSSRPLSAEEWQTHVQSLYDSVRAERMDTRTGAFIEHRTLGRARMTLVSAGHMVIHAAADQRQAVMAMMLCLENGAVLSHARRECELKAGDWILIDSALPSRLEMPAGFRQLIVETPRSLWSGALRRHMTMQPRVADDVTALPAYATAIQLWNAIPALDMARAGDAVLGLISLMHLKPRGAGAIRDAEALRAEAEAAIVRRVSDPALDADTLARELGISRRQLDRIFGRIGITIDGRIRQRRLEAAAAALGSPEWAGYRVLDIALEFGFKSQSHFGRRFRERFGTTPEVWRRGRTAAGTHGDAPPA